MPKRILEGHIVSDKMDKTVSVLVERRFMHPVYKKYVRRTDKYAAHDEQNEFKTGQRVAIEETKPISKRKTWVVKGLAGIQPQSLAAFSENQAQDNEKAAPTKAAEDKSAAPEKKTDAKKTAEKKSEPKKTVAKKDEETKK